MSQVQQRIPHFLRKPWSGLAVLGAFLLSGALVMQAVAATLAVSTATLPDGALTSSYSQSLTATGGTGSYTWSVIDGSLPAGLGLTSSTGVISGIPTVLSNSPLTVKVTDSDGNTATKALAIKVNPALTVATSALAAGVSGAAYTSQTLAATGGSAPYTWTTSSGALPTGLTLSAAGLISGAPTTSGTANFTAQVTDSASHTATKALTITVSGAGVLTVVTQSLPNAVQNVAYSQTVVAAGGTPAYNYTISAGTLPAGLTLAAATGVISGTPTATGTSNFTVQVTDGAAGTKTQALAITVNGAVTITTASPLTSVAAGAGTVQLFEATGGTPPYTWSVASGSLPAGMTLSASAGVVSGAATTAGTANFTLQASDVNASLATKAFAWTVNAASAPVITTTSLPNGVVGSSFTYVLQRSAGIAPFTWSVSAGSLPSWLTLDASTGMLTGTPVSSASAVNFTVQVTGSGGSGSDTQDLSITVGAAGALNITSASLPNGTQSAFYSQGLSATGGSLPYTWTLVSGSLPAGLSLSTSGAISGTPTTQQTSNFTVRVTDNASAIDDQPLTLTIGTTGGLTITTTSLANAQQSAFYSQSLVATGGTSPYSWSLISGSLPTGLSLSTGGVISGTPTVLQTSSFSVRVTDNVGAIDDQALSLTVNTTGGLTVTTTSLANTQQNAFYSQSLVATGGTSPYSWSLISGSLPTGLSLSTAGVISGTPTVLQTSSFSVRVTDNVGAIDDQSLSLTVNTTGSNGNVGNGDFSGPCRTVLAGSTNGKGAAFNRLLQASGAAAQVKAFCEANAQDDEFAGLCTKLFNSSDSWRSRGGKNASFRRLIEAAGAADQVRSFCSTHVGSFNWHDHDDDDDDHDFRGHISDDRGRVDVNVNVNFNPSKGKSGKH